ncbi:MAG TPA: hypothetical protein VMU25_01305 [Candidatus Paceibacterota bacterium]|nr:hypothetical protein [Candidatus Paceibacterota bacterium]
MLMAVVNWYLSFLCVLPALLAAFHSLVLFLALITALFGTQEDVAEVLSYNALLYRILAAAFAAL